MKRSVFIVLILSGLFAVSCKKTYTCDCTLERHYMGPDTSFTESYKNESKPYSKKMTKKQANAACEHEETSVLSNYQSASASFYSQTKPFGIKPDPNDHFSASCTLK